MEDGNSSADQPSASLWVDSMLGVPLQRSRFSLPMDMKLLENMSAQEYLLKHCQVSPMKWVMCQRIFYKVKDKTGVILFKDLKKALLEALVNPITSDQLRDMYEMLSITEDSHVDCAYFAAITAFAERFAQLVHVTYTLLYNKVLDGTDTSRGLVEAADFSALDWKLEGIQPNPGVEQILRVLNK
ncbi:uncharacterized protein LOC121367351 isoform X1 [Gigantopelta aegis]|uniref:uncharacterized protein LOC121367351 isoform X1 n=1 Tax=Gigantopelta aegis TaxID=1735272 RepID=UPI001B88E35A|nr:uncharacterized protein LOC121367351 isoform X1 [Gigantopelta aegis]